ncbi:3'-5' exonuclease [Caldicellulosiruptor morganii]|uniref:UvrD-like helicase C-terminal domain-containing protein n=1 Tax=Caldicellulosiruptor morganii TaxID=1387555 RepID=A0ABY7BL47_9FIRM|nr:3'-5' exonuclease [Caldicellulosiruptor morganii]WAM33550.1 hypothetical protein OTK00_002059 [Caldicellulosiruptor morganii]
MKKAYFLKKLNLSLLDNAGDGQLVILPRRFSIKKLRERLVEKNGVLFDVDIFTFDDLIVPAKNQILKGRRFISRQKEVMIVFELLKKIFKNKTDFQNCLSYEFISQVLHLLDLMFFESKDYSQKSFLAFDENYGWLIRLFEEYKRYLDENNLVNFSYLQDLAIKMYQEGKMSFKSYRAAKIAFFIDFREDQKRLLSILSKTLSNIEIYIPYFDDIDLCKHSIEFLQSMGFEILTSLNEESEVKDDIKAFSYGNIMLETNALVKSIKEDHINNGIDFSKIAVAVPNIERYKDILIDVFQQELLPVNLDHQKSLLEFGFIRFVVDLLEFLGSEFDRKRFEKIVAHRFLNREGADFEILLGRIKDMYILNLDHVKSVLDEIEFLLNLYNLEEEIENFKKVLAVFNRLYRLKSDFDTQKKSYREWILQTKSVFERLGLTKSAEFVDDVEFLKAFYALNEIFDMAIRDQEVEGTYSFDEFLDMLKAIFSEKKVDVSIKILNGIDILQIHDCIGSDYHKVYLIGASDDIFPKPVVEKFLFNPYLKNLLLLSDLKDFDYAFQKELVAFKTILNSYNLYISYPRFYRAELNKSPFLELEGIFVEDVEDSYLPGGRVMTYKEYRLARHSESRKSFEATEIPPVPPVLKIKDREIKAIFECPLKFGFMKFNIEKQAQEENFFSANLRLLYMCIGNMLSGKDGEYTVKMLLQSLRYTLNEAVKLKAAENILVLAGEIANEMAKYNIKEFVPVNTAQNPYVLKENFEGFEILLFPNFIVKKDQSEIIGFVRAKNDRTIDKIWIAQNIFKIPNVAAIYLQEYPKFVIYDFNSNIISGQTVQEVEQLKESLKKLKNVDFYRKTISSVCYRCEYSHVCRVYH